MENTFHVEILTRHPQPPETYESSFSGGTIVTDCRTFEMALVRAKDFSRRYAVAYATERRAPESGSIARPLVRFEAVRSGLDEMAAAPTPERAA